jgi:hypothetical protein
MIRKYLILIPLFFTTVICSQNKANISNSLLKNSDSIVYYGKAIQNDICFEVYCVTDRNNLILDSLYKSDSNSVNEFLFVWRIHSNSQTDLLKYNLNSIDDYYARLDYLTFRIAADISILMDNKSYKCEYAQYSRNYSIGPYISFTTNFLIPRGLSEDTRIIFNDKSWGSGVIVIPLSKRVKANE